MMRRDRSRSTFCRLTMTGWFTFSLSATSCAWLKEVGATTWGLADDTGCRGRTAVVRPLQPVSSAKPYVVAPTSFNQAQEVADKLKVNQPVIVNLQNVDRDLSRRIIDFASGLCYGIGGQMERVANQVFLLTPSNVEVSAEERRRLQEHGYHEG